MISYAAPSPSVPLLDILPLLPADARGITARLTRHLSASLGAWPPRERFRAVVLPARDRPGWDGGTWPGLGVESPHGTVFSLSPRLVATADAPVHELLATATTATDPVAAIVAGLGRPELNLWRSVFRWTERPAPSPNLGEWVPSRDPRLPAWLRAFGGDVLVAWDGDGGVAAGVGRKVHTPWAHELAVETDPNHRGRGLARALVARAARQVLADGAVPLYLHFPENRASARVAEAAGFPDRGWRQIGLA